MVCLQDEQPQRSKQGFLAHFSHASSRSSARRLSPETSLLQSHQPASLASTSLQSESRPASMPAYSAPYDDDEYPPGFHPGSIAAAAGSAVHGPFGAAPGSFSGTARSALSDDVEHPPGFPHRSIAAAGSAVQRPQDAGQAPTQGHAQACPSVFERLGRRSTQVHMLHTSLHLQCSDAVPLLELAAAKAFATGVV